MCLRKVRAHFWCHPSSYNPGRATSTSLLPLTLTLSCVTVPLGPTCDFWLSLSLSFYQLFFYQYTLFSPFPLLHFYLGILTSTDLLPFLEASNPPARLSYSTAALAPAAFQLLAEVLILSFKGDQ